ncbi:MAG: hypothetical protein ACTS73_02580 [Arsenophonus sp. NEOnobi-MAG3]
MLAVLFVLSPVSSSSSFFIATGRILAENFANKTSMALLAV